MQVLSYQPKRDTVDARPIAHKEAVKFPDLFYPNNPTFLSSFGTSV
jgi:hypothetical protein